MKQRFPRRARPLVAAALLAFVSFGAGAAAHILKRGPDLYARLAVIQVCRTEDEKLHQEATAMLRKLGPRALPALLERAREGDVPDELFFVLAELADETAVDVLAPGARTGSEARRLAAVRALARIGTREAALALAPCLADPREDVRREAKAGLRGHGSDVVRAGVTEALSNPGMIPEFIRRVLVEEGLVGAAVDPVVEALESRNPVRVGNALYLARHVFPEFPPGRESEARLVAALAGALDHLDLNMQQLAVEVLGLLDFEGRTGALCGIARNRRYAEHVRAVAVQGLGLRREAAAVETLEEIMKVPRFLLRDAASTALGKIGNAEDAERWLRLVEKGDAEYEPRELYLRALSAAGAGSLTPRLLALVGKFETPTLLEAIRRVAAREPVVAIPALLKFLHDAAPQHLSWIDEGLRELTWHRSSLTSLPRTMEEFVRLRDAIHREWTGWWEANRSRPVEEWRLAGITEIEKDLVAPSAETRYEAVVRLIRLDPSDLESRLLARIDEPEEYVWGRIVEVFLSRASSATLERLRDRLAAGSERAAARSARVLGMLEDKPALEWLLRGAERRESAVRRECAFALGRLGETRAIPALLKLLKDGPADVSAEARISLETLGDRSIEREMITGLGSPDRDYRLACTSILGRVGGPDAIRPLIRVFDDTDEVVQRAALRSVQQLTGRAPGFHPTEPEIAEMETLLEYRRR